MKKILFWLVWNVPLGKLAPVLLGIALKRKSNRINLEE